MALNKQRNTSERKNIPIALAHEAFRLDNEGGFCWRRRPRVLFSTDHEWQEWNETHANQRIHARRVTVNGKLQNRSSILDQLRRPCEPNRVRQLIRTSVAPAAQPALHDHVVQYLDAIFHNYEMQPQFLTHLRPTLEACGCQNVDDFMRHVAYWLQRCTLLVPELSHVIIRKVKTRASKYPWNKLREPGDSFTVEAAPNSVGTPVSVSAFYTAAARRGFRVSVATNWDCSITVTRASETNDRRSKYPWHELRQPGDSFTLQAGQYSQSAPVNIYTMAKRQQLSVSVSIDRDESMTVTRVRPGSARPHKYPWPTLQKPGDSFTVAADDAPSVTSAFRQTARAHDFKVSITTHPDGSLTVTRVADGLRRSSKYPWSELRRPGDAFTIAPGDVPPSGRQSLYTGAGRLGLSISIRRNTDGSLTVTRVADGLRRKGMRTRGPGHELSPMV